MNEPTYKLDIFFGSIKLDSWFKRDGDKLIGMGSKTTYDESGKFISYEEEETGVNLVFE